MPADERFTIRAYRDGDEHAILDLFNRSFPHAPRAFEHFRWKYLDDPAGARRIALAFDEHARLVGHYAGYPVVFRLDGRDVLANQIGDTMTDPSIRHVGRGPTSVLGRTALHFYGQFCEGVVAFNYGFNVANIQKFSLRFLRSDRVEPVTYRVASPPEPPTRFARRLQGYTFERMSTAGREFDDLFRRASPAYRFLVKREAEYLRWRYLDAPDAHYHLVAVRKWTRLVGWIVFRLEGSRLLWGDALFDQRFDESVGMVLGHVARVHSIDRIECWFPPRPAWFDRVLTTLGFVQQAEPNDLSVMCVPFLRPDAVDAMRRELYYAWGDSDLF
jgi:hypothetical protein